MTKTVLITGASGLVGNAALEHFLSQPGWNVIAVSDNIACELLQKLIDQRIIPSTKTVA